MVPKPMALIQGAFRRFSLFLERGSVRPLDHDLSFSDRWSQVRKNGNFPLAYPAVTEPYLFTFGDGRGLISYAQKMGFTFALGDPIALPEAAKALIAEFLDAFSAPIFVASQRRTAEELAKYGYYVNQFGFDTVIELPEQSFGGASYKRIRYASNWLRSRGGIIVEAPSPAVSNADIRKMSAEWRKTRVTPREILFLNRRFSVQPGIDVRRFYALSKEHSPMGYIDFDPVYSNGEITGYLASQKRRMPDETAYLDLAIMRQAIDTFREEGRQALYLGISPIADVQASGFDRELRWLRHFFRYAHTSDWVNSNYFNTKGLAEYKNRFRGRQIPLYLCLPPRGPRLLQLLALLILTQVV